MVNNMADHDYSLTALCKTCEDSDIKDIKMDKSSSKKNKINPTHTPIKIPNPKKIKGKDNRKNDKNIGGAILHVIQVLTRKVDDQTELLKHLTSALRLIL